MEIDKRKKPYCVVVGGLNLDIQAFCSFEYQPKDSNPGQIHRSLGGVGRNIAENLVRLGLNVELITVVGDSSSWDGLVSRTEKLGISLAHSLRIKEAPLSVYLCIL
ncbi:MAG TPA: PfkB family carbohydrate kinase, partial [Rectinema sp.]|nr:PfkB family carbohydrate kinase [Rectinema sp.]